MDVRVSRGFEDYTSKRISFVLATKNRGEYLKKALHSCRSFITPEDELILVDGHSKDHTDEVVKESLDVVSVFVSEPDLSNPEGFNKGFLLARGKYIKTMSDDDVYYPEALEQAVKVMEENPEVSKCHLGEFT